MFDIYEVSILLLLHFLSWCVLRFSATTTWNNFTFPNNIKAKKVKTAKSCQGWTAKYHTDYWGYKSNTIKPVSVQMLELLNSVFPPKFFLNSLKMKVNCGEGDCGSVVYRWCLWLWKCFLFIPVSRSLELDSLQFPSQ